MELVSIDIETTGLDPKTCSILQVAAIVFDSNAPKSLEALPKFNMLVKRDAYRGEPRALSMHAALFGRVAEDLEKGREGDGRLQKPAENEAPTIPVKIPVKYAGEAAKELVKFIKTKCKQERITVVGKNFAAFDFIFFKEDPHFIEAAKLMRHRIMDIGSLYVNPLTDEALPGTEECLKRAGLPAIVSHDALDDSWQVVQLVWEWAKKNPSGAMAPNVCNGCGRKETHKFCPAYGTAIYCNPSHPEWGKASDERLAELQEKARRAACFPGALPGTRG